MPGFEPDYTTQGIKINTILTNRADHDNMIQKCL